MLPSATRPLVEVDDLDRFLANSFFKTRDFERYKNPSLVRSSFRLLHAIETKRFPSNLWDQVLRIKEYCEAENRMSVGFDWVDEHGPRVISLYQLVVFHGKLPKRLLDSEQRDLKTDLLQVSKLNHLVRFFRNKGRVFECQIEDPSKPTISSIPDNLLTGVDVYAELTHDDVLQRATSDDLGFVLGYLTKAKMIAGLLSLGKHDERKLKAMNKSQLSVLLTDEKEIRDTRLWESFYVLTKEYQALKDWYAVQKVYMEMADLLTGERDIGLLFLSDMAKKLRNACMDDSTATEIEELAKQHGR